jgi:chromosome partitioning protein
MLIPNRVDARTREGKQLVDELIGFRETVSSSVGYRATFVRAFMNGLSMGDMANGQDGHNDIRLVCDLLETTLHVADSPKTATSTHARSTVLHDP